MALATSVEKVIVVMEQTSKDGFSEFYPSCALPRTGRYFVDMVIKELAVMRLTMKAHPRS